MAASILLRKNAALAGSLKQVKQRLEDAESKLNAAQATLGDRDNTLSVFERHWAQLEEQLALVLAGLDGAAPREVAAEGSNGSDAALKLVTPVQPLTAGAPVDSALSQRCERMLQLGRSVVSALQAAKDGAGSTGGASLAAWLQSERSALSSELALRSHECERLKTSLSDAESRAAAANHMADKATRELTRERARAALAPPAAAAAAAAAPVAAASAASATGGSGGDAAVAGAAAAAAEEAKQEAEAQRELAEKRLLELENVQVELQRLRTAEQEAGRRAVTDEQLRMHPAYKSLSMQVKEMHERAQSAEARIQHMRNDAAQINTLRHSESARFEEWRNQQLQQAEAQARKHAADLNKALSERRSIELSLAQMQQQQKREEGRANDADARLRQAQAELARAVKEVTRLRGSEQTKVTEMEAARQAHEKALEECTRLRQQLEQSGAGGGNADDVAKKYEDALVKLGTAELRASKAQQDLKSQEGAQQALMDEIEAVSAAYEEAQSKADELRATLSLREDALNSAKTEKMRADQLAGLIRSENSSLKEKVEAMEKQSSAFSDLRSSLEAQLSKISSALQKKDEEIKQYEVVLTQQKNQAREATSAAQGANAAIKTAQEAEARAKQREEALAKSAAAEAAQVKRLGAENEALSRKLQRALSAGGGGRGGGLAASDMEDQMELYRMKVKCSLCKVNDKDAVISKCMHAFCRECIQKRLDVRNRKCPACSQQFDYQAVKDLYLTN